MDYIAKRDLSSVYNGEMNFKVKTDGCIRIALTTAPHKTPTMIEVIIGGSKNSKSIIRRKSEAQNKYEYFTIGILHREETMRFWLRWEYGFISVGRHKESDSFLAWKDPEPFVISHVGITTDKGTTGNWTIDGCGEFTTNTEGKYTFFAISFIDFSYFPIYCGKQNFKVKSEQEACIALSDGTEKDNNIIELILGGCDNTICSIRRNDRLCVHIETINILKNNEMNNFWVHWDYGLISIGRESETTPIMSWRDLEPFVITYFGINSSTNALWKIDDKIIKTGNSLDFLFLPITFGSFDFGMGASSNFHLILTEELSNKTPIYEVFVSNYENDISLIKYCCDSLHKVSIKGNPNPEVYHDYKKYSIKWSHRKIVLQFKSDEMKTIELGGCERDNCTIRFIGMLKKDPPLVRVDIEPVSALKPLPRQVYWVSAEDAGIPSYAIICGVQKNDKIFTARAIHEGLLTPGSVSDGNSVCYITNNGLVHEKYQFEVLCGKSVSWEPMDRTLLPENILPAGKNKEGESVYVGRTIYENIALLGRVEPSDCVLYVAFKGKVLAFMKYEILCLEHEEITDCEYGY